MKIIAAHKYVSPRARPLTAEEAEVRRIAYALKIPTAEALHAAAPDMALLLDAAEAPGTALVLMPVPTSAGTVDANRMLANMIANQLRAKFPTRRATVKTTVGRMHPVESSCARRRRGLAGLHAEEHAMVRVCGPLTSEATAYYFVDNVATTGATLNACRLALHFGDALVWADAGHPIQNQLDI